LAKLFEGGDVLARRRILVIPGVEYLVQGMQERATVLSAPTRVALGQAHIIIDIDVVIGERGLERRQGRGSDWQWERPVAKNELSNFKTYLVVVHGYEQFSEG
jgi:hypothetical protein